MQSGMLSFDHTTQYLSWELQWIIMAAIQFSHLTSKVYWNTVYTSYVKEIFN